VTARIHPDLAKLAKGAPRSDVDVIVRVSGDPQSVARALPKGTTVRRVFTLSPSLAVTSPAELLPAVAALPGVTSVEPDGEVRTQ
jgi:hypothetical protein